MVRSVVQLHCLGQGCIGREVGGGGGFGTQYQQWPKSICPFEISFFPQQNLGPGGRRGSRRGSPPRPPVIVSRCNTSLSLRVACGCCLRCSALHLAALPSMTEGCRRVFQDMNPISDDLPHASARSGVFAQSQTPDVNSTVGPLGVFGGPDFTPGACRLEPSSLGIPTCDPGVRSHALQPLALGVVGGSATAVRGSQQWLDSNGDQDGKKITKIQPTNCRTISTNHRSAQVPVSARAP